LPSISYKTHPLNEAGYK